MTSPVKPAFGPRLPSCRLILSMAPTEGLWNMAVDEALLDAALESNQAVIRWYTWSKPTVSLGYFQTEESLAGDALLAGLPRVRRLTGGGAIVHHHEWTYSCILPPSQQLVRHPYDLYDLLHSAIAYWFHENQEVTLAPREMAARADTEPPLCFLREGQYDYCLNGVKVLGSAQRRRKGALLQHGSLILKHSEFAPQVAGLLEAGLTKPLNVRHSQLLAWQLGHAVGEKIALSKLTEAEQRRADELVKERTSA